MKLNKAAFLDIASVDRGDLDRTLLEEAIAEWLWFDNISETELLEVIKDIDVVVSNKVWLGETQLHAAEHLKLICVAATGTNNVDLNVAQQLGIPVRNVQAYSTPSVVQHVFSLLLSLVTRSEEVKQAVKRGDWSNSEFFCLLDYPFRELSGKVLGVVGYGELGKAVTNVAKAFGMKVLIAKRDADDGRSDRVDLHDILRQVDVLSLHCPLTESNRHFIAEQELALMKPESFLINTARGGLVDEKALLDALENKRLAGAALDVLEHEPPSGNELLINSDLPNLIITPHVAWASIESRQRLIDAIARNINDLAG